MRDNLLDLIQNTQGLAGIDLAKVEGTDQETTVFALAEDRSLVIYGTLNSPLADFIGVFGMPNLSKLKTILSFDEYDKNAKISTTREDRDGEKDVPVGIHFETESGDFINDYRLMTKNVITDRVNTVAFKGANWNVEFVPTVAGILRLKKQAQANSEEDNFTVKTENGDLKIFFGDHSTHSGNFVFQPGVTGTIARSWQWPVKVFLAIMDLAGDKTVRISDQGAAEVTVDSGLATYRYLLPAKTK